MNRRRFVPVGNRAVVRQIREKVAELRSTISEVEELAQQLKDDTGEKDLPI